MGKDDLEKQFAKLEKELNEVVARRDALVKKREEIVKEQGVVRKHLLARTGKLVPIVCPQCQGMGNKDVSFDLDNPEVVPCDYCGTMGYHLAVVFQGPMVHDMSFDERPLD